MGSSFSRSRDSESEDESASTRTHSNHSQSASKSGPAASGPMTGTQAERRYGVEIESGKQLRALQRMEGAYGMQVAEWAQEGMPIEAMGTPSQMEVFRERKGTPVPWNVEEHNEQSVQRSADAAADASPAGDAGVPESVRDVISSPGQSLDVSVQRAMEQRMGDSFGDVRVHAGPTAARACEEIDARAFTVGNHVAFNSGEYDPSSPEGQHVLAHEIAHVRQQTGGTVSMLPKEAVELEIDPESTLEREAEETAQRVMAGGELGIRRLAQTELHVQRNPKGADSQVFTAKRNGKTKALKQGSKSKGWIHIKGRHIEGTLDTTKQTSFFPTGQTVDRPDGSMTLDPVMSETDVQTSIKRAVERGSTDPSDPADVYVLESADHRFDVGDIRVITGMNGDVITAYPVEGPRTPAWKPTSGWENV